MEKTKSLIATLIALILLCGCNAQSVPEKADSLCIATWNVQNLFNAVDEGGEYEEYRSSSRWNQGAYDRRLSNVRKVLSYLPQSKDYAIVLNEVERSNVVEDLIKSSDMASMGIRFYACTNQADSAIQTAVISSMPIGSAHVHDTGEGLRPVLEVRLDTPLGPVFILAVHFKSNIGGVSETSVARLSQARVVAQVARLIEKENPGCVVIVAGDMNEECWDDVCLGRGRESTSPLRVSSSFEAGSWYCFWMDDVQSRWPGGSYMYRGVWKCYDNILLPLSASDGVGWEFGGCGVLFSGILMTVDGRISPFNRELLSGVSDHLPVWASLGRE